MDNNTAQTKLNDDRYNVAQGEHRRQGTDELQRLKDKSHCEL